MFLAIWVMEYLIDSKKVPLILGGEGVNLECLSDASFGILEERRSIKAHFLRTNEESGAIYVNASVIKNTVTSIWEAEVSAASDAVDTMSYARNLCGELKYPTGRSNTIKVDNKESAINWMKGECIAATTKHVEARPYRMRQIVKEG